MVAPNGPSGTWQIAWNDEFNDAAGMSGNVNGLADTKWNVGWYFGPSSPGGTGYKGTSFTASSGAGAIEFYGPGALTFPVAGGVEMSCFAPGDGPDGSYNSGGHTSNSESGGICTAGIMNITPNTGYSVPSNIASTVIQASSIVIEVQCQWAGPNIVAGAGSTGNYWQWIGHYNCGDCSTPDYPNSGAWTQEIDIWESFGGGTLGDDFYLTFHEASSYGSTVSTPSADASTDLSLAFHTYTVEYTYSTVQVWVDGVAVSTINPTAAECEAQWATPQYLGLMLQLTTDYVATGASSGGSTATPMKVNYVRVFTPGSGPPPPGSITCSGGISLHPFGFSGSVNTGKSGSISVDPTTPAVGVATGSASTTITTATFSPPANTLLVVLTSFEYQANNTNYPVFAVSDSVSGTYAAGPSVFDGTRGMAASWSRYVYVAPGAMTVTVTNSGVTATHGQILAVYVLDGANAIQAKAATATAHSATATGNWTGVISTTTPGSWVMIAGAGSAEGTITANANTVTLENEQDATDKVSLLTGRQIVPTGGG